MLPRSLLTSSVVALAAATAAAAASADTNPARAAAATGAIYVSPLGIDTNPGTKAAPKREIQSAIILAAATGKDVYVAAGFYGRVVLTSGVDVYGGYGPETWRRDPKFVTEIQGDPEAVYAN